LLRRPPPHRPRGRHQDPRRPPGARRAQPRGHCRDHRLCGAGRVVPVAAAGARPSPPSPPARRTPRVDDFLVEPTRELEDWHWLWKEDREFPIRSHRGLFGRVLVAWKRLLRPLVKVPQNDLWERQRIFNVILLEHLRDAQRLRQRDDQRIAYLEALNAEGIEELMRHNDGLYARADQKLDRRRPSRAWPRPPRAGRRPRARPQRLPGRRPPAWRGPATSTPISSWRGGTAAPSRKSASASPAISPISRRRAGRRSTSAAAAARRW